MRLIDADKIEINEECTFSGKGIKAFLNAVPTAYDVDKVVEQMEEYVKESSNVDYNRAMIEAIEIVKSGGIE